MSELALQLIADNRRTRALSLDLGNCGLTEIPLEISALVWLERLTFAGAWHEWRGREWAFRHTKNQGSLTVCGRSVGSLPSRA